MDAGAGRLFWMGSCMEEARRFGVQKGASGLEKATKGPMTPGGDADTTSLSEPQSS